MASPKTVTYPLRPSAEEAFAVYAAQVAAHREQSERLGLATQYTISPERMARFRPEAVDAPEMAALEALALHGDTWIDIGAGGGRFAVPLSRHVQRVVALEPAPLMREALAASIEANGRPNIEVIDARWPLGAGAREVVQAADGVLAANVLNGAADLRVFLEAMETHARRICAVLLSDRVPVTPDPALFEELYGERPCPIPALIEFIAVLGAWGRTFEVRAFPVPPPRPVEPDRALEDMRWRYGVAAGSEQDARLRALLIERYGERSGLVHPPARRSYTAVVSWSPPTT